jgi:hypothetical protein
MLYVIFLPLETEGVVIVAVPLDGDGFGVWPPYADAFGLFIQAKPPPLAYPATKFVALLNPHPNSIAEFPNILQVGFFVEDSFKGGHVGHGLGGGMI